MIQRKNYKSIKVFAWEPISVLCPILWEISILKPLAVVLRLLPAATERFVEIHHGIDLLLFGFNQLFFGFQRIPLR